MLGVDLGEWYSVAPVCPEDCQLHMERMTIVAVTAVYQMACKYTYIVHTALTCVRVRSNHTKLSLVGSDI